MNRLVEDEDEVEVVAISKFPPTFASHRMSVTETIINGEATTSIQINSI